jgi:general secretion pathway protein M
MEARLKGPPVALMSHVSQAGTALGIEVTDLRPTGAPVEADGVVEESVEVNLPRIDLPHLARLLEGLERSTALVKVRRLRVSTRTDDPKLVDVTVVVATYHLKA